MHTEALRTTERLRRTDVDTVSYEFTVDDPKIFTKPSASQDTFMSDTLRHGGTE